MTDVTSLLWKSNPKVAGYFRSLHATIVPVLTSCLEGQYCSTQCLCLSDTFDGFSPPAASIALWKLAIQEEVFRSVPAWFLSASQPKCSCDSGLNTRHYEHKPYGVRGEQHLHLGLVLLYVVGGRRSDQSIQSVIGSAGSGNSLTSILLSLNFLCSTCVCGL